MNRKPPLRYPLCALLILVSVGQSAAGPTGQVVVLRHGGVLRGQVRRERDRLVVAQSADHILRVPLSSVDFVVDSLEAAYQKKLGRIDPDDLQGHFQLAQWCLRNHLPDQAADRLLHISRQEPTHPAVQVLEARLRQLTQKPAESRVVPASHVTPVTAIKPKPRSEAEPLLVKQFPVETMTQFTRYVQPLLLNRCGQTTCHGSATPSGFQLLRGPHGVQTQVLTWQNLKSSLLQVDDQEPEASPLLRMAHSVHGAADRPPFEPYELKQFELLRDWVQAVISGKATTAPEDPLPAAWQDAPAAEEARPAGAPAQVSRDPFDPADFNSRFALPTDPIDTVSESGSQR